MWDSFLIFAAQHPFIVTLTPLIFALLIFRLLKLKIIKICLLYAGLFTSMAFGIFLHIRWDSFTIHFLDQNLAHIRDKSVLFIGDSITCEGRRPRGFITKFEAILSIKTAVVCAKGSSTEKIVDLLNSSEIEIHPDLIVAQSGINDLLDGVSLETSQISQEKLISKIKDRHPKAELLFLPIHPIIKNGKLLQNIGIAFPPYSLPMWDEDLNFIEKYLVSDGIHLNAKGNSLLAKRIIDHFSKSLGKAS
jgi:lysophospholipase L1-like esterase